MSGWAANGPGMAQVGIGSAAIGVIRLMAARYGSAAAVGAMGTDGTTAAVTGVKQKWPVGRHSPILCARGTPDISQRRKSLVTIPNGFRPEWTAEIRVTGRAFTFCCRPVLSSNLSNLASSATVEVI